MPPFVLVPLAAVVVVWSVVAFRTPADEELDLMDRTTRIQQLYGYTVCLVAVVVFFVNAASLIDGVFTLSNPLQAADRYGPGGSLTSFEAYKATVVRDRAIIEGPDRAAKVVEDTTPEPVLRRRYEALKADQISRARFDGQKKVTRSLILLLCALVFFIVHWRWLSRRVNERAALPTPTPPASV